MKTRTKFAYIKTIEMVALTILSGMASDLGHKTLSIILGTIAITMIP